MPMFTSHTYSDCAVFYYFQCQQKNTMVTSVSLANDVAVLQLIEHLHKIAFIITIQYQLFILSLYVPRYALTILMLP